MLKPLFCFWIILFALMTSCSVGPPYSPPTIEVPPAWKHEQSKKCEGFETDEEGELVYLDHWWEVFEDEKLEELEDVALRNNKNLFIAFERIQEARALMGIAAADLYPQLTLNPLTNNTVALIKNYSNSQALQTAAKGHKGGQANPIAGTLNNLKGMDVFRVHQVLYFLPLNLSYEVDLWGKIRDQYNAATYTWLAIQKDYDLVMLNLTASLATTYYQLRVADAQLELLSQIIKTRQKAFEINQARYEEQITFYADVTLAAEEVDLALNQYQEVSRQRDVLEDQIAVLLGIPASEFSVESNPLKGLPPCIPEGIPSEVLLRRPDIAEAEYNMKSEHQLVKQAHSLFYPSLTLTATTGFQSPNFKDFLKWISRYWMDSVQINQVVFDGGRLDSNLKLKIARFEEASGSYQQQVLIAFQEVENSLTNLESYTKEYELALATTQWAQKTYQLYLDRYTLGVTYYIDVANTERDLLNYQLNVNALEGYRYLATIQLIRALGGGW